MDIEIVVVGISDSEAAENYKEIKQCDVILYGNAEVISTAIKCIIGLLHNRGVLHKEAIISLLNAGTLLKNADLNNVQPASYDLQLSDKIWCKGRWITLSKDNPTAIIPPYSYIIVKALEEAKIPKFITGRYDVKVSLFLQGIILSNGPQVDPGYPGVLLCLLFNASDRDVGINRGEHFATIEFFTTSKVTEGYSGRHKDKKEVADFMEATTAASSGGTIVDRFDDLIKSWSRFKYSIITVGLILLGIIITALFFLVENLSDINVITNTAQTQQSSIKKLLDDNKKNNSDIINKIDKLDKRLQQYENKSVKNEEIKKSGDISAFEKDDKK